jgi:uncharacterized protein YbaR (Trm112 family)
LCPYCRFPLSLTRSKQLGLEDGKERSRRPERQEEVLYV